MADPDLTAEYHETEAERLLTARDLATPHDVNRAAAHAQLATSLRLGQLHEQLYGVINGSSGIQVTVL